MNFFDNECRIIEELRSSNPLRTHFINFSLPLFWFVLSLYIKPVFTNWIDNASNTEQPPDYYNDKTKCMLEIMRVDDYKEGPKHPNALESKRFNALLNELKKAGKEWDPEHDVAFITGYDGDFSDNNLSLYLENFKRIVGKHIDRISEYRKTHPGYKMAFLIFDESPGYIETKEKLSTRPKPGDLTGPGRYYHAHKDQAFMETILSADIDYLIWMTPYKWIFGNPRADLKMVYFLDVNKARDKGLTTIDYNYDNILCMEVR